MKRLRSWSWAAGILLGGTLVGCAGSGPGSVTLPGVAMPGIYRGTVSLPEFNGATQIQAAAQVQDLNNFSVCFPSGSVSVVGGTCTVAYNGSTWTGPCHTEITNGKIEFSDWNGSIPMVSGSLQLTGMPLLATDTAHPPSGSYSGFYYVIGANGLAAFGSLLSASVSPNQTFAVSADSQFFGTFGDNHAITNSTLINGGQVITESTPQYSFDGTTLVMRFDQNLLMPETEWIVLTKP